MSTPGGTPKLLANQLEVTVSTPQVLAVDRAWAPMEWLDRKEVLNRVGRGLLDYSVGEATITLRGGVNARTGKQSIIEVGSILVLNTRGHMVDFSWAPPVSKELLFRRDLHICAYCGGEFGDKNLSIDHVHPQSRGGADTWMNLVSACLPCNQRKANRRPEEAGMQLLYVPYVLNRAESLILSNRRILGDQMEFLASKLPKHSRVRHLTH